MTPLRWLAGTALVAAVLLFARALSSGGGAPRGLELGRQRVASLEPALAQRVAALPHGLVAQWFATPRARLPSEEHATHDAVDALFAALREHGARTQVLHPEADPEAARHAAALGIGPFRARRIVDDGWTETEVWGALRLVVPGQGATVVRALDASLAPRLQRLVEAELTELATPRRPRVALSAPPGHILLRRELELSADVREIDLDVDAAIPADCDLALWIAPRAADERHVAALADFLERGGSVLVAASRWRARTERGELHLEATRAPLDLLLAPFGVEARAEPVFEMPAPDAPEPALPSARVRSIASDQDFRALGAAPNGTLAFDTPSTLAPLPERLALSGSTFTALASPSRLCVSLPAAGARASWPLAELEAGSRELAHEPLLALIEPGDPTHGRLVVAASEAPFGDHAFLDADAKHAELVRALVGGLASGERRALAAVAREAPPRLPELSKRERWTWRALCVALVPLLLVAFALARRARERGSRAGRGAALALLALVALLGAGIAARASAGRGGLDLARSGANRLPPELVTLAGRTRAPLELEIVASPRSSLPPQLRGELDDARALCDELARSVPGAQSLEIAPDALASDERALIADGERTHLAREGDQLVARRFCASLYVRAGASSARIDLGAPASAAALPFRVAHALVALERGRPTRVAFLAERERVTPAEALALYQRQGLFAPGGGDAFGAAALLLAAHGFEVLPVDPQRPELPADVDLVVWMQPRRDASAGIGALARHLHAGGAAFVAAGVHRVRPRARATESAELDIWPEPLFPDVDRLWLPRVGVELSGAIGLDLLHGALEVSGTSERDGRATLVRERIANPLVVRSTPAGRPATELTRGVGDVALLSPSPIELDVALLVRHGLAARPILASSARGWTAAWSGGPFPREALVNQPSSEVPFALAVLVEGTFPGPEAEPELGARAATTAPAGRGKLALIGCSEPFRNEHLANPDYDHARLLAQSAAALTLPTDVALLLARQPTSGGFGLAASGERLAWRLLGLVAPLAALFAGLGAWRWSRARRFAREALA